MIFFQGQKKSPAERPEIEQLKQIKSDLAGSNRCHASRQSQCIFGQSPLEAADVALGNCCEVEHYNAQVQVGVDCRGQLLFLGQEVESVSLEQE